MSSVLASLTSSNDVRFLRLGDVVRLRNGSDHKMFGAGSIPVYGSGGIMRHIDTAAHPGPSVLIPRKGSLGNIFYVDAPFWTVDTIFYTEVNEDLLVPKFFYYVMVTQRLAEKNQAGGVPSMTQSFLNDLQVPVPPLEIQREVVRVLDPFTQLEAELEAELEARRIQYAHLRDVIFDSVRENPEVSLGDIASIGTGSRNTVDATPDGLYPFYVRSQQPLCIGEYEFEEEAVITAGDGVGVGKVFHYAQGKYALHQRAYRIVPTSKVLRAKYLFHLMRATFSDYLLTTSVHASVTSLRKPMFERFPVLLPSLESQDLIVGYLDRFDALVGGLEFGIPAEIAARRKQYEYYRDSLLSFR